MWLLIWASLLFGMFDAQILKFGRDFWFLIPITILLLVFDIMLFSEANQQLED